MENLFIYLFHSLNSLVYLSHLLVYLFHFSLFHCFIIKKKFVSIYIIFHPQVYERPMDNKTTPPNRFFQDAPCIALHSKQIEPFLESNALAAQRLNLERIKLTSVDLNPTSVPADIQPMKWKNFSFSMCEVLVIKAVFWIVNIQPSNSQQYFETDDCFNQNQCQRWTCK